SSERILDDEEYVYGSSDYDEDFDVPVDATPGPTRLRVMAVYYVYLDMDPCADALDYYYYGEAEDYTINIPNDDPGDLGVVDITSLATGCGLGSEEVSVEIFNIGTDAATSFDVAYTVNGGTPVVEAYDGASIPSLESATFTFTTPVDLSASGDYEIKAYTIYATDETPANDTSLVNVTSIPIISTYPYVETYESGSGGWSQYGTASSWELGEPDGPTISGPPPATPTSENSWATDLTGYYNSYEMSYVEGPCFDFSTLILPYVELDIWWETYSYTDGAQLEYSLDAGITWELVGDLLTGDNWYPGYGYSLGYDPDLGAYENGWVGSSGGWLTAHHDLTFLAGESQVKFRMRFGSSWYPYYDGIAFDNFTIDQPPPNDIGVIAVVAPASATVMGVEEITVTVQNFGTNAQSDFDVFYQIDGAGTYSATYTGTLDPGMTGDIAFTADPFDFTAVDDYHFLSWTELTADDDITNDTLDTYIHHLVSVTGTDAYYIHLSTEDPFGSSDNIDKMDEVFGTDAWTEEFFDTMNPDSIFNINTCFVYIDGGSYTAIEFKNFIEDNISQIEDWVSSGGNLFLNAAPYEGSNIELGFEGVKLWYYWYVYSAEATEETFPIFTGPHTPVGTEWYGWWYSFAHARVSGDFTPLINDMYYSSYYMLGYKEWGDGSVLFGTMTPAEYHTPDDEASNLRLNIFEFLKYCSPIDLGVVELISPDPSGCGLTEEEQITIMIENFGPTTVNSFPVKYSVDGGEVLEIATILVESGGGTGTYTFDLPADLSALGLHTIDVWTDVYVDEDHTNDTLHLTVTNLEAPVVDLGVDTSVCDEITLDAENAGMIYLWSDGVTTQTNSLTVAGDISVSVTHPSTGCVVSDTINLDLTYTPAASFDALISGLTVTFTNMSSPGALYTWYFGDGTYSTEFAPSHTFTPNAYTVVLVAENECGYSYFDTILYVGVDPDEFDAIDNISLETRTVVYPNPASNYLAVAMNFDAYYEVRFEMINSTGQIVVTENAGNIKEGSYRIDISNLASGPYQLRVKANDKVFVKPVIITKE
ncbi:MAG: T9SS type A sorting domain-containing protein, partial [Fimbriimonadaceae bacterium]|nr:T9SS type A sorting domain-containing protein [Chitinophagales bacterium]